MRYFHLYVITNTRAKLHTWFEIILLVHVVSGFCCDSGMFSKAVSALLLLRTNVHIEYLGHYVCPVLFVDAYFKIVRVPILAVKRMRHWRIEKKIVHVRSNVVCRLEKKKT